MVIEEENIKKGLLPCGCDHGSCKCKLSAFDYMLKYQLYIGSMIKTNKKKLKQKKGSIIKEAGKQLKKAYLFSKSK